MLNKYLNYRDYISVKIKPTLLAGIYLHIPYCKQKCTYCDFYFSTNFKNKKTIIKTMLKEIIIRKNFFKKNKIESVYFGGGTPSLLTFSEINLLLTKISKIFKLKKKTEITIECNPDDLSENKLLGFKKAGINRLSIGVQSFKDNDLKFMNRSHTARESIDAIKLAQKIGFKNISVDLIYGLPKQSLNDWKHNLDTLFNLGVQHFSAYSLTIEKKTALYYLVKKNKISVASDKKMISQFKIAQNIAIKNGFIHYEISNFGKEGYFSKHNITYWNNNHYLGIGPSAHSFNGHIRSWNISSNKKYIAKINNKKLFFEEEKLNPEQMYNEYILTSLRTIWGVNSDTIEKKFGKNIETHFLKEIKKWVVNKHIYCCSNTYFLTEIGRCFVDGITSDLFIVK